MKHSKKIDFLVKPQVKPEIKKVSVKLLFTPKESEALDDYSILSGVGKNEVCSIAVKRLLGRDKKFKSLITEMSDSTKKKLFSGKLKKGEGKKVIKKVKKIKKMKKPVGPTMIKSSGHNPAPFNPLG